MQTPPTCLRYCIGTTIVEGKGIGMMKVRGRVCKMSKSPPRLVLLMSCLQSSRITSVVTRLQQESPRIKLEKVGQTVSNGLTTKRTLARSSEEADLHSRTSWAMGGI